MPLPSYPWVYKQKQENRAVAGKPRDVAVNFDTQC